MKARVKQHSEAPVCCGWVTATLVLHRAWRVTGPWSGNGGASRAQVLK